MQAIAHWDGVIPGAQLSKECGNYQEHDLQGAREWAAAFEKVLENWMPENLVYPQESKK